MPCGNLSDKDRIKRATPDRHFERTWPRVLHAPVLMGWNGQHVMGIDTLCLQPALGSSQFPKASLRRSSSQRRHCTTELEPNLLQSVCSTWTSAFRQERLAESLHAVFPYAAPKVSFKIQPESVFANRSTNANGDVGRSSTLTFFWRACRRQLGRSREVG